MRLLRKAEQLHQEFLSLSEQLPPDLKYSALSVALELSSTIRRLRARVYFHTQPVRWENDQRA